MDGDICAILGNALGKLHGCHSVIWDTSVGNWVGKILDAIILTKDGFHSQAEVINFLSLEQSDYGADARILPMRDLILQPVSGTRTSHDCQLECAGGINPIKFGWHFLNYPERQL